MQGGSKDGELPVFASATFAVFLKTVSRIPNEKGPFRINSILVLFGSAFW